MMLYTEKAAAAVMAAEVNPLKKPIHPMVDMLMLRNVVEMYLGGGRRRGGGRGRVVSAKRLLHLQRGLHHIYKFTQQHPPPDTLQVAMEHGTLRGPVFSSTYTIVFDTA